MGEGGIGGLDRGGCSACGRRFCGNGAREGGRAVSRRGCGYRGGGGGGGGFWDGGLGAEGGEEVEEEGAVSGHCVCW